MAVVDERVLQMVFENDEFEKGIKTTIKSLETLEDKLQLKEGERGFEKVGRAATTMQLGSVENSLDKITDKFTLLGNIGYQAMQRISNAMVNMVEKTLKSFTVDPISEGFQEYEMKMNSIQTILAGVRNDYADEATAIAAISANLDELNEYADKTIYKFSDMTANIGKFTNQGVELDKATAAIKGISNWAAAAGADTAQAGRTMYNISQSLASGHLQLIDYRSIEFANMATTEFRDTAIELGKAWGKIDENGMVKKGKQMIDVAADFRDSLSTGWLDNELLMQVLAIYSNEYADKSAKELADYLGVSEDVAQNFLELGAFAEEAATKVKTFTQLMDVLKEAAGSGWAQSFDIMLGGFDGAKEFFTSISQVLEPMIGRTADMRNNWLQTFADWGGTDAAKSSIYGLVTILDDLHRVIERVVEVVTTPFGNLENGQSTPFFRSIFGLDFEDRNELFAMAGTSLSIASIFADIADTINRIHEWGWTFSQFGGNQTPLQNLQDILKGIGAVVAFIVQTAAEAWDFVGDIAVLFTPILESVLGLLSGIGQDLYDIYFNLVGQRTIQGFFDNLYSVVAPIVSLFSNLVATGISLVSVFVRLGNTKIEKWVKKFSDVFKSLPLIVTNIADGISTFIDNVKNGFKNVNRQIIVKGVKPFRRLKTIVAAFTEGAFGKEAADKVRTWFDNVSPGIANAYTWIVEKWNAAKAAFAKIPEKITTAFNKVKAGIEAFKNTKYDSTLNPLQNFSNKMSSLIYAIFDEDTANSIRDGWNNHVYPAIMEVVGWYDEHVKPKLAALWEFIFGKDVEIGRSITANGKTTKQIKHIGGLGEEIKKVWTETLEPALIEVKNWITTDGKKILEDIWAFLFGRDVSWSVSSGDEGNKTFTKHIPGLVDNIAGAWESSVKPAFGNVQKWITTEGADLYASIHEFLFGHNEAFTGNGPQPFDGTIHVPGLIDKISGFWTNDVEPAFAEIQGWCNTTGSKVLQDVSHFFFGWTEESGTNDKQIAHEGVFTQIKGFWDNTAKRWFEDLAGWASEWGPKLWDFIGKHLFGEDVVVHDNSLTNTGVVVEHVPGLFDKIKEITKNIYDWCTGEGAELWNRITGFWDQYIAPIVNKVIEFGGVISEAFKTFIMTDTSGVEGGFFDKLMYRFSAAFGPVGNWVFKNLFGVEFGDDWLDTILTQFENMLGIGGKAEETAEKVEEKTEESKNIFQRIGDWVFNLIVPSASAEELEEAATEVQNQKGLPERIADIIGGFLGSAGTFFSLFFENIQRALGSFGTTANIGLAIFGMSKIISLIRAVNGTEKDSLLANIASILHGLADMFRGLATLIAVGTAVEVIPLAKLESITNAITTTLNSIFGWIAGIAVGGWALDLGGDVVRKKWLGMGDKAMENTTSIATIIGSIGTGIKSLAEGLLIFVDDAFWYSLITSFSDPNKMEQALELMSKIIGSVLQTIVDVLTGPASIFSVMGTVESSMVEGQKNAGQVDYASMRSFGELVESFSTGFATIVSALTGLVISSEMSVISPETIDTINAVAAIIKPMGELMKGFSAFNFITAAVFKNPANIIPIFEGIIAVCAAISLAIATAKWAAEAAISTVIYAAAATFDIASSMNTFDTNMSKMSEEKFKGHQKTVGVALQILKDVALPVYNKTNFNTNIDNILSLATNLSLANRMLGKLTIDNFDRPKEIFEKFTEEAMQGAGTGINTAYSKASLIDNAAAYLDNAKSLLSNITEDDVGQVGFVQTYVEAIKPLADALNLIPDVKIPTDNIGAAVNLLATGISTDRFSIDENGLIKEIDPEKLKAFYLTLAKAIPDDESLQSIASFAESNKGAMLTQFSSGLTALAGAMKSYGNVLNTYKYAPWDQNKNFLETVSGLGSDDSNKIATDYSGITENSMTIDTGMETDLGQFVTNMGRLKEAVAAYGAVLNEYKDAPWDQNQSFLTSINEIGNSANGNIEIEGLGLSFAGILTKITGSTGNLGTFAGDFNTLAEAMGAYIGYVNAANWKNMQGSISLITRIKDAAVALNNNSAISVLGANIGFIADGVGNFIKVMKKEDGTDWDLSNIVNADKIDLVSVVERLAAAGAKIGEVDVAAGKQSMEDFGKGIGTAGKNLKTFWESVSSMRTFDGQPVGASDFEPWISFVERMADAFETDMSTSLEDAWQTVLTNMNGKIATPHVAPVLDMDQFNTEMDLNFGYDWRRLFNVDPKYSAEFANNLSLENIQNVKFDSNDLLALTSRLDKLKDVETAVSNVSSSFSRMYVRIDSNALVGAIVQPMDIALGKRVGRVTLYPSSNVLIPDSQ